MTGELNEEQVLQRIRSRIRGIRAILEHQELPDDNLRNNLQAFVDRLQECTRSFDKVNVGIVGQTSVGKSSFVNSLLHCDTFLRASDGSTTKFVTHISYAPTQTYTAHVHFYDRAYIKAILDKILYNEDIRKEKSNLSHFYKLDITKEVAQETALCKYIDHDPIEISGNTPAELSRALHEYMSSPSPNLIPAVSHIRIEGPFESLPPGITLVDTPGYNDGNASVSERTFNSIRGFDEIWCATRCGELLSTIDDQWLLSYVQANTAATFRVIGTFADTYPDTDNTQIEILKSNVLNSLLASAAGIYLDTAETPDGKELINEVAEDERKRIKGLVDNLVFQRTTSSGQNREDMNMGVWELFLTELGTARREKIEKSRSALTTIENELQSFGLVHRFPNDTQMIADMVHNQHDLLDFGSAFAQFNHDVGSINLLGFTQLRHRNWHYRYNTVRATMNPSRRGRFMGKYFVDLNLDLAYDFLSVLNPCLINLEQRCQNIINGFYQAINIQACSPDLQLACFDILQRRFAQFQDLKNCILRPDLLSTYIQSRLTSEGAYSKFNRNNILTDSEVLDAFTFSRSNLMIAFNNIGLSFSNILMDIRVLLAPVNTLPNSLRDAITRILQQDTTQTLADASVIGDLECSICFNLMCRPVSVNCAGWHTFCLGCIETKMNHGLTTCPLCQTLLDRNRFVERYDLADRITLETDRPVEEEIPALSQLLSDFVQWRNTQEEEP